MLSKKIKRREPCFFLEKLFKILKKKKNNQIIHWNEDGSKVVISDPIKFTVNILPKHFNHQNYSSFVRQLNLYGFNKINNIYNSTEEQFFNENFKRDKDIEDIKNIKRKDLSYPNGDNPSKKKLSETEIKKQIIILDSIKKENNDEKKIEDFKKLIDNGNINIKSNIQLLEFLIQKFEEKNNFDDKIRKEISKIKEKNKKLLETKIFKLNSKIDKSIEDCNETLNISNHLKETSIKKSYSIQQSESLILKNERLDQIFKNEPKINKDNDKPNLNDSFFDELSKLGYSKNPVDQTGIRSSYILLNKSGILIEPNINNNENSTFIRQNMTNSFYK